MSLSSALPHVSLVKTCDSCVPWTLRDKAQSRNATKRAVGVPHRFAAVLDSTRNLNASLGRIIDRRSPVPNHRFKLAYQQAFFAVSCLRKPACACGPFDIRPSNASPVRQQRNRGVGLEGGGNLDRPRGRLPLGSRCKFLIIVRGSDLLLLSVQKDLTKDDGHAVFATSSSEYLRGKLVVRSRRAEMSCISNAARQVGRRPASRPTGADERLRLKARSTGGWPAGRFRGPDRFLRWTELDPCKPR